MCVLVPEQTESLCAGPRNKMENGYLKSSKSLFYVLVSFMPLAMITLKSLYIYIVDNKKQRKKCFCS